MAPSQRRLHRPSSNFGLCEERAGLFWGATPIASLEPNGTPEPMGSPSSMTATEPERLEPQSLNARLDLSSDGAEPPPTWIVARMELSRLRPGVDVRPGAIKGWCGRGVH